MKRIVKVKWNNLIALVICLLSISLLVSDGITIVSSMFSYTKSLTTFGCITDLFAIFAAEVCFQVLGGE